MLFCRAIIRQQGAVRHSVLINRNFAFEASYRSKSFRAGRVAAFRPVFASTLVSTVKQDTIFALSTAPGKAGVAVIRISGNNATEAVQRMTHMKSLPVPRQAMLKKIYDPESNELLDNAIVLWFPGPHSYTGEDTVEFHIHGGNAVTQSVLDALDKLKQFRIAERGEFSRRAFDNDKLDLTELEGLADLLNAETEMQRKIALRQADGSLRHQYESWRQQLIKCMALTEAVIDFGEDENIEDNVLVDVRNIVEQLRESLRAHLNDNRIGEILRDGIHITISGPPNAGKSSFLNLLARREAAIVSDIPGTTRDVVEVSLNLGGYPVVISDTAGIRASTDTIEMEGVKRAKAKILSADMHMCLLPLTEVNMYLYEDHHALLTESITPDTILIINKSDIDNSSSEKAIAALSKKLGVRNTWLISCRTGQGIDTALKALNDLLKQRYESTANSSALITHSRHRSHLNTCLAALDLAAEYSQTDIVLAAEELRQAATALGRITVIAEQKNLMLSTHILSFLGGVCFGLLCLLLSDNGEGSARQLVVRASSESFAILVNRSPNSTSPGPNPIGTSRNTSESVLQWGHPGPISDDLHRDAYMANYNRRDRLPNWVAEHLDAFALTAGVGVDRNKSSFQADSDIPTMFGAQLKDYLGSGFDRGHQAPAADAVYTQAAMDQTFLLTNMAPQIGIGFNRQYWAYVEAFVRDLVGPYNDVWVWTGPLFLPQKAADNKFYMKYQVIGNPPNVAVPTHFYKIVLAQKNQSDTTYSTAAFLLPNQAIPTTTNLTQFKVAKDLIERAAGLTFLTEKVGKTVRDLCSEVTCDIKPGRP